jgi:hypothetical protein
MRDPDRLEQGDTLHWQAARSVGERGCRRRIEPLGVVDRQQDTLLRCGCQENVQDGSADRRELGARPQAASMRSAAASACWGSGEEAAPPRRQVSSRSAQR